MTFVFATDDRSLLAFASEAKACGHAEGIDVENSLYLFFDDAGRPLSPVFSKPNEKGRFTVVSGVYSLQRRGSPDATGLLDLLPDVTSVEGELGSVEAVRQHLTRRCSERLPAS
jgi:hypothetical protein